MDKRKVFEIIKVEIKPFPFEPTLILAIAEQESSFDETSVRMENRFRELYLKHRQDLATTSAILLSTSYGLMQTLGEALLEEGYFEFFQDWYKDKFGVEIQGRSQIGIAKGIDEIMLHADWQIRFGIKHFQRKFTIAQADRSKALLYYNGGGNKNYPLEVEAKYLNYKQDALFT